MSEVMDRISKAVQLLMKNNQHLSYIELRFFKEEYKLVWEVLNELKIFDITYNHVKLMVDDTDCIVIIGAGDLK